MTANNIHMYFHTNRVLLNATWTQSLCPSVSVTVNTSSDKQNSRTFQGQKKVFKDEVYIKTTQKVFIHFFISHFSDLFFHNI